MASTLTLSAVEATITDVLENGQSTTQDGTTYTAANLKYLIDLRDSLKSDEGQSEGTRPTIRAVGFSTMGYSTS